MLATELLRKKRDLGSLSREEISFFFQSFLKGDVADFQASAMLMAFCMGGLSDLEIQALTETMIHSGKIAAWPVSKSRLVDKHSTVVLVIRCLWYFFLYAALRDSTSP